MTKHAQIKIVSENSGSAQVESGFSFSSRYLSGLWLSSDIKPTNTHTALLLFALIMTYDLFTLL